MTCENPLQLKDVIALVFVLFWGILITVWNDTSREIQFNFFENQNHMKKNSSPLEFEQKPLGHNGAYLW